MKRILAIAAAGFILAASISEAWSGSIVWLEDVESAVEYVEKRAELKRQYKREAREAKEVAKEQKTFERESGKQFKAYKKQVEKEWKKRYGKSRGY